jgi:protocatechuate 3,4-dioxygenase beta subunit
VDGDDAPVGRILTRREILALFGGSSAALLAACAAPTLTSPSPTPAAATAQPATQTSAASPAAAVPSCVVRPALTEGPYFVDEKLDRSDIRSDPSDGSVRQGIALSLTFNVSRVAGSSCSALAGAVVDVWHCDALGVYSDVAGSTSSGQRFLRGFQRTDAAGQARFTTIYPGWYQGRAVHIHFKIRTGAYEFTSQFFFDEIVTDRAYAQAPYSQKTGARTRNESDGIFRGGGDKLLLQVTPSGAGYAATFDIGVAAP